MSQTYLISIPIGKSQFREAANRACACKISAKFASIGAALSSHKLHQGCRRLPASHAMLPGCLGNAVAAPALAAHRPIWSMLDGDGSRHIGRRTRRFGHDQRNTRGDDDDGEELRSDQDRKGQGHHLALHEPAGQAQRHEPAAPPGDGRGARRTRGRSRDRGGGAHRRGRRVLRRTGHQALFPRRRRRPEAAPQGRPRVEQLALAEALDLSRSRPSR